VLLAMVFLRDVPLYAALSALVVLTLSRLSF
jgi:hypothetical protein